MLFGMEICKKNMHELNLDKRLLVKFNYTAQEYTELTNIKISILSNELIMNKLLIESCTKCRIIKTTQICMENANLPMDS